MSRLFDQLREAIEGLRRVHADAALIGGLALSAHGVVRATQDVDFLVDRDRADAVDELLVGLGYACVHRSEDAANYRRQDQGLDLIYAHRPGARRLLAEAEERQTSLGPVRVLGVEGLIAFKLQAIANDPSRLQDRGDIAALVRANRGRLDADRLRGFFRLFEQEAWLDELLG